MLCNLNRREDEWDGSFENRTRFPLAVTEAVLEAAKTHADDSFIVGYRLSPEEVEKALASGVPLIALAANSL